MVGEFQLVKNENAQRNEQIIRMPLPLLRLNCRQHMTVCLMVRLFLLRKSLGFQCGR